MDTTQGALVVSAFISTALSISDVSTAVWSITSPPLIEATATAPISVRAGDGVIVDWRIIKRTKCDGHSSRVWHGVDGFYLSEAEKRTAIPQSDTVRTYRIPTTIPKQAPVGELRLMIAGRYECDGVRSIPFNLGPVIMQVIE